MFFEKGSRHRKIPTWGMGTTLAVDDYRRIWDVLRSERSVADRNKAQDPACRMWTGLRSYEIQPLREPDLPSPYYRAPGKLESSLYHQRLIIFIMQTFIIICYIIRFKHLILEDSRIYQYYVNK